MGSEVLRIRPAGAHPRSIGHVRWAIGRPGVTIPEIGTHPPPVGVRDLSSGEVGGRTVEELVSSKELLASLIELKKIRRLVQQGMLSGRRTVGRQSELVNR